MGSRQVRAVRVKGKAFWGDAREEDVLECVTGGSEGYRRIEAGYVTGCCGCRGSRKSCL